jgi:hypothetical protein
MCIHAHCAPPLIWGFSHDNYRFEHKVRFLCGERQTTGMKQAEALVEREAKERCESDEGAAASAGGNGEEPAAAVADLASTVAKKRIANADSARQSKLRETARDVGYKPIEQAAATAAISERVAATLRPLVKTIVEAGRKRANIHFDVDELRAKVNAQMPGTKAFKDLYKQLMRVDEQLRDASTKFDDALRATLRAADEMDAAYVAGDMSGPGPQFSLELADIFCKPMETVPNGSKPTIVAFLINTVCPPLAISSHNNIFYTIVSTVLWLAFIVLHFVEIGAQGWWAMAWMSYTMMALIVWDVRGKARATHGVTGNMIEDFFAALLFHGGVLTQVVAGAELAADDLKTASA